MPEVPEGLRYTSNDVWVREGNANTVRIGVTAGRAEQLADVVHVTLPQVGEELGIEDTCAQVASTVVDGVWDVLAPASGVVTATNPLLTANPELLHSDSYGDGWLFDLESEDAQEIEDLLDADGYAETSADRLGDGTYTGPIVSMGSDDAR